MIRQPQFGLFVLLLLILGATSDPGEPPLKPSKAGPPPTLRRKPKPVAEVIRQSSAVEDDEEPLQCPTVTQTVYLRSKMVTKTVQVLRVNSKDSSSTMEAAAGGYDYAMAPYHERPYEDGPEEPYGGGGGGGGYGNYKKDSYIPCTVPQKSTEFRSFVYLSTQYVPTTHTQYVTPDHYTTVTVHGPPVYVTRYEAAADARAAAVCNCQSAYKKPPPRPHYPKPEYPSMGKGPYVDNYGGSYSKNEPSVEKDPDIDPKSIRPTPTRKACVKGKYGQSGNEENRGRYKRESDGDSHGADYDPGEASESRREGKQYRASGRAPYRPLDISFHQEGAGTGGAMDSDNEETEVDC